MLKDVSMRANRAVVSAAAAVLTLVAAAAAVILSTRGRETPKNALDAVTPSSAGPSPAALGCSRPWDCAQRARFADAARLVAGQPGRIGLVMRDRTNDAVWRIGETDARIWSGSTPKLALAVALLEDARAGTITLDPPASHQIAAMLSISDNAAADRLWDRYADAGSMMARFHTRYGMGSAGYVSGFPRRWGFIKCTAEDLANLMSYVLETLNAGDRAFIVSSMRTVGAVQQWGVWGSGSALRPGVKNGWSIERDAGRDHWITATVGFAGPAERYVVAAMYDQPPGGDSIGRGVHVLTDLVATIFGAPVPAPAIVPTDY